MEEFIMNIIKIVKNTTKDEIFREGVKTTVKYGIGSILVQGVIIAVINGITKTR